MSQPVCRTSGITTPFTAAAAAESTIAGVRILHFCGRDDWAVARERGEYHGDTLQTDGFIHCSTAEQVHVPANALARGRTDLVLLEIDPGRLASPLRWEPGDPTDAESVRFPHVYDPIPVSAVVAVHDFPPAADGSFACPEQLRR